MHQSHRGYYRAARLDDLPTTLIAGLPLPDSHPLFLVAMFGAPESWDKWVLQQCCGKYYG